MAHIHKVYDTDTHFQLDSVRKELKIAEGYEKVKVIQNDHNSERFTFELPRYIEGHDMSICNKVEVHYLNVDSQTKEESRGVYSVDDLQISPEDRDKVICSWLISHNATKYVGSLFFVLRFECNTGDNIDYVLNTLIYEGIYVGKGIYNSETVITEYADVLEAWRLEIFGAKDGVIKFIEEETQKVINTIPEDYTETVKKVDRIYNNVANAIKGNVSGSVVAVDDVSPIEHKPTINVHSKNFFDISKIPTMSAISNLAYISEVGDNYLVVTTPTDYTGNGYCTIPITMREICPGLEVGKTYILTATTESNSTNIYLPGLKYSWVFGKTMTITEEMLDSSLTFYGLSTLAEMGTGDCKISNIQIEEGETATEYTPYIDPTTVNVTRCGKNLIPFPYVDGDISDEYTNAGITYTVNADKSITANGTATTNSYFRLCNVDFGKSYIYENKSSGEFACSDCQYDDGNKFTFIMIVKGTTVTNKVYRPQVESGTLNTEWESPKERVNYIPSSEGTVLGMTSLSPNMTIITDTDGVIIECKYIRDSNKVIDKLINAIVALGGSV